VRATQELLLERRSAGAGVLMVSEDLDELMSVADRIVVLHDGAIVHDGPLAGADRELLVHLAAGGVESVA
jgi:ABC-type uncharacterized transport system ATPase subunit